MSNAELIKLIEKEWDLEQGFLGKLRAGKFIEDDYVRFKKSLQKITSEIKSQDQISRRLTSLIWYIPLFMNWQSERVAQTMDLKEYEQKADEIQTIIEEALGTP